MSASPSLGLAGKLFLYGIIGLEVNLLFKQETQVHNKQKILVQLKMKWMRSIEEVDGISNRTEFNNKKLLDGTETDGFTFQIGANAYQ